MNALIDRTYTVRLPNGKKAKVNRFDYNLKYTTDSYVQLTDGSWNKARSLQIIGRK